MTQKKRLIRGILLTAMLMMLMSVTAMANTYTMSRTKNVFKKTVTKSGGYDYRTDYLKLKVSNPGMLIVMARNSSGSDLGVTLLNYAKKDINYTTTRYGYSDTHEIYYGLRPGTYFLKITTGSNYYCVAQFNKYADNGRAKLSQALTMSWNKAMPGVMSGAETYTVPDWYRIYVPSRRDIRINYDFRGNGNFKITLRNGSGSYSKSINYFYLNGRKIGNFYTTTYYSSYGYGLTPGTYYIGITRNGKGSNAMYYLRWNYK